MRFFFTLLVVFATAAHCAEAVEVGFGNYSITLWEAKDGLSDQTIQALAQTPDGSLWIGTKGGLLRFDGVRFTAYGRDVAPADLERGVNCLLTSKDGSLWIGTEGGGLVRYHRERFTRYATSDGLNNQFVRTIYLDHRGRLWAGADQGLFRVDGQSLIRIDNTPRVPAIFVRSILEDRAGHMWVGGTRLFEFSEDKLLRQVPLPDGLNASVVTTLCSAEDGTLWVGMLSGLYRMEFDGSLKKERSLSTQVGVIHQTTNQMVWIGTVGQGLFAHRSEGSSHFADSKLPSKTVRAVLEDREGDVWLGTQAGLVRLSRTPVSILPFPGGADSEFETLYLDRDESVWVAASRNLFRIRNGVVIPYQLPGLKNLRVRTVLRSRKGGLWVGTDGAGLIYLHDGKSQQLRSGHGLINDFVRAILESRDGSIWVGTDGGLTHVDSKGSDNYDTANGLAYFSVTSLFEDSQGNIWVGTSRGLTHLSGGRVVRDQVTRALAQEQLWSVDEDSSGTVWFGTSNGLYGMQSGKLLHFTTDQGLASNTICQILHDRKGNVWLAGPNSVSRLREHDLNAFKPGDHLQLTLYENPHGLESAALYSGMQPEGAVASNGDVWFPSNKGAVRITAAQIIPASSTPVSIEQVSAEGQPLPRASEFVLKPGNGRLEITYGAIHLSSQGGLRYRYQMEGLEPWTDAFTRRTAYYTHLPAGHYVFRVQAYQIDTPGAVSESSIVVVQKPYFYVTPWFIACCGVVLAGLGFGMYRFRLYQMRVRFQAVNDERVRLAREMHDSVIQGCVGVSTLLEAAQGIEVTEEPLREQLLNYAVEQIRGTIDAAREAVWALRNTRASEAHLGVLCHELCGRVQRDSGISIRCSIVGVPYWMSELATHELLMAVKEALNNAVSHASANSIDVQVSFLEHELNFVISDDGCGFDPEAAASASGHFGLVGMKERIRLLNGTLEIESKVREGTILRISIPRTEKVAVAGL